MKRLILVLLCLCAVGVSGCFGDDAAQTFETAQFEELQNNPEHARELYERIIRDHPTSTHAKKARERLTQLDLGD